MKSIKIILLFFSILVWVMACTKTATKVNSTEEPVKETVNSTGASNEELAKGQLLYEQHCGRCHKLYKPESRTEEDWRDVVPPMSKKAKIDDATQAMILKYLLASCK